MLLFLAFLIGILAGLRSMTPAATLSWATYLGWLKLEGLLSLIGSLPLVIIFTLFAIIELIADKLPRTPNRTSLLGLIARIMLGALAGGCVAVSGGQGLVPGALLGAIGGIAGSFGGYQARARLVKALGTRDTSIALLEDLVTIGGCLWVVSRL